jgi:hypothetical protein
MCPQKIFVDGECLHLPRRLLGRARLQSMARADRGSTARTVATPSMSFALNGSPEREDVAEAVIATAPPKAAGGASRNRYTSTHRKAAQASSGVGASQPERFLLAGSRGHAVRHPGNRNPCRTYPRRICGPSGPATHATLSKPRETCDRAAHGHHKHPSPLRPAPNARTSPCSMREDARIRSLGGCSDFGRPPH